MSQIITQLPIIYCTPTEFFDKLEELYLGQVLVVARYEKEKDEIIRECFMRTGNTTYQKLISNNYNTCQSNILNTASTNGDENNVIIREKEWYGTNVLYE